MQLGADGDLLLASVRRTNPLAMGFCFLNTRPDACYVKRKGTKFAPHNDWTTISEA